MIGGMVSDAADPFHILLRVKRQRRESRSWRVLPKSDEHGRTHLEPVANELSNVGKDGIGGPNIEAAQYHNMLRWAKGSTLPAKSLRVEVTHLFVATKKGSRSDQRMD
jgi:hypothetical protein